MTISRCYLDGVEGEVFYQLCGYCDASLFAYAAVVYLLIKSEEWSPREVCGCQDESCCLEEAVHSKTGALLSRLACKID